MTENLPETYDAATGEVVPAENASPRLLSPETIRDIKSYQAAIDALVVAGVMPEEASDFKVVDDKGTLCGIPMVFLQWRFNEGDMGTFVSIEAVTEDGRKVVINDGSTGILPQMQKFTEKKLEHPGMTDAASRAGLVANNGLRRSDFTYTDEKGKKTPATTFYVSGL